MSAFDVDLFVIGAGSGGVRAGRGAANRRRQGHGRRGVSHRRNLRDRGCSCRRSSMFTPRVSPGISRPPRVLAGVPARRISNWPKLVAAKEAEISRLSGLFYRANLNQSSIKTSARARWDGQAAVKCGWSRAAGVSRRNIFSSPTEAPERKCSRKSRGLSTPSPPTRFSTCQSFSTNLRWSGAAISPWNSPASLPILGKIPETSLLFGADEVLRGFDDFMRDGLTRR